MVVTLSLFPSDLIKTQPETALLWVAAAGLLWPAYWADIGGTILFGLVLLLQKRELPKAEEKFYENSE